MRIALTFSLFLTCMSASWAQAQAPVQPAAGQDEKSVPAAGGKTARPEKRIENIHIEDKGARIDEVREGGETKSITVQPKGGMPEYKIEPSDGTRRPSTGDRDSSSGSRVWKILGF
jgi:hypothetical protein